MPVQKPVIHLVGSIPLDNTEKVFRNMSKVLGDNLCRLPDGETGKRLGWIKFLQHYPNNQHPDMETDVEAPLLQWRQWDGCCFAKFPWQSLKMV